MSADPWTVIWRELAGCIGPARARTLDQLAAGAGIYRRSCEILIQTRLADLPFCVVADGSGYYRPTSAEQINAYRHSLRRRHQPLVARERTVERKAAAEGWLIEGDTFVETPGRQGLLFAPAS